MDLEITEGKASASAGDMGSLWSGDGCSLVKRVLKASNIADRMAGLNGPAPLSARFISVIAVQVVLGTSKTIVRAYSPL